MTSRPPPRAFKTLLLLNFFVWFAGYQVFSIVPLHLRDLGASLAASGRFAAFLALGTATGALLMGRLGDRIGQTRLMRCASSGIVLIFLSYAWLESATPFLLMAPLHGLLWAALKISLMAQVTQTEDSRATNLSWFGISGALGVALGPLTALFILPYVGFNHQILATATIFAAIAMAPGLPYATREKTAHTQAPWPGKVILAPALLLFAWGWGQGLVAPFSAQEARLLHVAWPSALLTCFALGMMASRSAFGVLGRSIHPSAILPHLTVGGILAMACLALLPGGLLRHAVGGLLFGASLGLAHTLLFANAVSRGGARRGETVGLMYLAYEMGMGAGAALVGQIMESVSHHWCPSVGFRSGWALGGCLLLLVLPLAWRERAQQAATRSG